MDTLVPAGRRAFPILVISHLLVQIVKRLGVHPRPCLTIGVESIVRFRSHGRLYRVQLFKDVPERNGGFKIFRYYDEDPEIVIVEARSDTAGPVRREEA